jgi:hypothetical protein
MLEQDDIPDHESGPNGCSESCEACRLESLKTKESGMIAYGIYDGSKLIASVSIENANEGLIDATVQAEFPGLRTTLLIIETSGAEAMNRIWGSF